jgi:hypothetical protein
MMLGTMHARDEARGLLVTAARIGYAAHGVVYCVVGVLALMAVFGERGGAFTDSHGALHRLGQQPFGAILLGVTALGLSCYSGWNVVRAVLDPEHPEGRHLVSRLGYAISAVSHALLAVYAARRALGVGAGRSSARSLTAEVLSMPLGRVLVGIIGLSVVGFGVYQVYKAYVDKVRPRISACTSAGRQQTWARLVGRIGTMARGLVFPVIGASLVSAAFERDPREARGFGQALHEIAHTPFGEFSGAFVAAGLFAYGGYMLFAARYADVPRPG